jgi:hypothetical protein
MGEIPKFVSQVEQLHKEVPDKVSRQRRKQMEGNSNFHLVRPNFSRSDSVLRAEPKRVQHKMSLIWTRVQQVDSIFDNHTLRVNSLFNGAQFIIHLICTRFYQDAMLQTEDNIQGLFVGHLLLKHCKGKPSNEQVSLSQ